MSQSKVVIPLQQVGSGCSTGCSSAGASGCSSGGCGSDLDAVLRQEGWVRRTTIGEPRLSEVVENYRAMGYEVHVERWDTGDASCTTCYDAADKADERQVWGTVYVRQSRAATGKDELF